MTSNGDITIFNKVYNRTARSELFVPTVIKGVYIYNRNTSNATNQAKDQNQDRRHECAIRIPVDADTGDKVYTSASTFRTAQEGFWTIQMGDVIVLEAVDDGSLVNETELLKKYDSVIVAEYTDNTRIGSRQVQHWHIEGV